MKIAIAGYGLEGKTNYDYWSSIGGNEVTILDEKLDPSSVDVPYGAQLITGPDAFNHLEAFDMVIRTAGLSPKKLKSARKIWSATNEFFEKCPVPIIGVTGTKGKGTTSSMIAAIFEAAGRKVWLVGNIGTAALRVLDQIEADDIVVYELSSFQLWDIERSPQTAVVLGIEPEHLDVHDDLSDYIDAKSHIRRFQAADDFCVYNAENDHAREIAEAVTAPKQGYGLEFSAGAHVQASEDGEFFYVGATIICATAELQLKGRHNVENACAAVAVAHHLGVSNDEIADGLRRFKGLPHRLEYIATVDDVAYYNDSFSSSTPAVLAAVRAFSEPQIVILGGVDRGGDFASLADQLKEATHIKEFVLIGEIRTKLATILSNAGLNADITQLNATTMRDIVRYVRGRAEAGDVVILSPGCASFDMFKDFYDRGDQFRREVKAMVHAHDTFRFDTYRYDPATGEASFRYSFASGPSFIERVALTPGENYNAEALDRALFLAFLVIGTSYFKAYPTPKVAFLNHTIDEWQASFLNNVYQEGLSQFAYENQLTRDQLAQFSANGDAPGVVPYSGEGIVALQSGGKDSLLVAAKLAAEGTPFTPWYLSSSSSYPHLLDDLGQPLVTAQRTLDLDALQREAANGARNGHVPVTYIVQSLALVQAILLGKNKVFVSIAHEGEEPHAVVGDLDITHQWSKTWQAERQFAAYVHRYIAVDLHVGSPLRQYSELRVAELFVQHAWEQYGTRFSSCNRANYRQAADNAELHWCGDCPKCANSYLLFAPFVAAEELQALFAGQDLFTKPSLEQTFKGLLGIDGVMKPFECVGEIDELRTAYHWAQKNGGYGKLPFAVPKATFDYLATYPSQADLLQ